MKYTQLADKETIDKVMHALRARNIEPHFVENKDAALATLKGLIPDGATIMTGLSQTLEEIGFTALLKSGNHKWINLKDAMLAEKDPVKQLTLRKQSTLAEYAIGSVHAITGDGQTLTASGSGSQLPGYAYSSDNVIWVAGAHKIVKDVEEGLQRIREHSLPLEDKRMKAAGYPGSAIGRILIFSFEGMPNRKVRIILVNEALGF
jgi:LUD domain